jgi:hypothetical protein
MVVFYKISVSCGSKCKDSFFWDFESFSLVELITLMMAAATASEMSLNFCHTTWCNILEDSHIVTFCTSSDLSEWFMI